MWTPYYKKWKTDKIKDRVSGRLQRLVSCRDCKHFRREEESWEMPWIWYYVCKKRGGMSNLKSFPFHNTKCKQFESKEGN